VPGAEVVEDILRHSRVVNDDNDAHPVLADRAASRVNMPHAQDEVSPPLVVEAGQALAARGGLDLKAELADFRGVSLKWSARPEVMRPAQC
jgi:hypothetical protein